MKMKNFTIPDGVVIAFFFMLPFLFGQEIAAKVMSSPTQFQNDLLEVKVYGLIVDPYSMQPVVLLVDPSGELVIPIWIAPNEAAAIQELIPMLAESFSLKKGKGVLIADVKEGSQAEKDGIQRGDILVKIGEQEIEDVAAMKSALAKMKGPAKVKIFRPHRQDMLAPVRMSPL